MPTARYKEHKRELHRARGKRKREARTRTSKDFESNRDSDHETKKCIACEIERPVQRFLYADKVHWILSVECIYCQVEREAAELRRACLEHRLERKEKARRARSLAAKLGHRRAVRERKQAKMQDLR